MSLLSPSQDEDDAILLPVQETQVESQTLGDTRVQQVFEQDEEAQPARPIDLYHKAALIMQKGYTRVMHNLESFSEALQTSRRNLQRIWSALAETACRQQVQARDEVLTYVGTLAAAEALQPILFISHNKYDESPLRLQCKFSVDSQYVGLTKIFAVEHTWAMVLEFKARDDVQHLFIQGAFAPRLLGTESATAETINKILDQCNQMPEMASGFLEKWRLTETDEGPNNMRAEAMLARAYLQEGWHTSHTTCAAHKIHSIASKTWCLHKPALSGAIKSLLSLQAPGALARFLDSLLRIAQQSLVIRYNTTLSAQAQAHRARALQLFGPDPRTHRRAAKTVQQYSDTLLNGDWQAEGVWHICDGSGRCCRDQEHTRTRMREALPKLVRALQLRTLARNDWKSWQVSLQVIGFLSSVHSLFRRAFLHAFGSGVPLPLNPPAGGEANADPDQEDQNAAWRREVALNLSSALAWWRLPSEENYGKLWMLRAVLDPQTKVMDRLLKLTAAIWDHREMALQAQTGQSTTSPPFLPLNTIIAESVLLRRPLSAKPQLHGTTPEPKWLSPPIPGHAP